MSASNVVVYERKGHWAAGLRRHLPRETRLRETRTLAECRRELAAAPATMAIVEATPTNIQAIVDLVADVKRGFPQARIVAVAQRGCETYEWLLREAGAMHFTTSPRTCGVLAQLAANHATRVSVPRTTLAAQIWDSLPWPESAAN